MQCIICQTTTENPKFCSRTCSGKIIKGNALKLKERFCLGCHQPLHRTGHSDRRTLCDACNPFKIDWSQVLYKDVAGKRLYQKNSTIRRLARQVYERSNLPKCCQICGYDKHYEIHHKKSISLFSSDTPVSQINDIGNLQALCPNHHWEIENPTNLS